MQDIFETIFPVRSGLKSAIISCAHAAFADATSSAFTANAATYPVMQNIAVET